jgi:acyl carrier protein
VARNRDSSRLKAFRDDIRLIEEHMPTAEQTLDEIMSLAATHFKVPREQLHPDDDFFKTLGINSLQTLELLTRLENHFHVELPDYELQGVSDFRTLAGKIQARL